MRELTICVISAWVWLLLIVAASPVHAGQSTAVRVAIVDAKTNKPLIFAQVSVYGGRSARGESGLDGTVTFEGLPAGSYELVVDKAGYVPQTLHAIGVTLSRVTAVPIRLQREARRPPDWLRTIARVGSKEKPKASTTQTTSDSPEAKLSNSMVAALQTLPNVATERSGFAQYPSIGGHPANETAVSIEGVPVNGFGGTPNLQPFNLDLFSSVNISKDSAYADAGGTINFDVPDPTLDWTGLGNGVEGSFGDAGLALTEKGTTGRLGLVATLATRDEGNPLDGMRFLDSSGLSYVHNALAHTTGYALKARYPFSLNNVLSASIVTLQSNVPLFCTVFTGPTPCGYGPLNEQSATLTSAKLRDSVVIGRLSADVSLFHNRNSLDVDQSGRYVNGVHLPQVSDYSTLGNGIILNGQLQVGRGYPVTFNLTRDSQTNASSGNAFGTIVPPPQSSLAYTNASISAPLLKQRRFSSDLSLGTQREGTQSHANAQLSISYNLRTSDAFALHYSAGLLSAPVAAYAGIADAPSLQFNCESHDAVGFGPSTPSNDSGTRKTTLSWNHTGRKISAELSLHHEIDRNASVSALVNARAFDPAFFTQPYLAAVESNSAANCGATAPPLTLDDLYYQVNAAVSRVVYDGGELALHVDASRNVSADISYGTVLARAYGSGGLLFSNRSTLVSGRQLPNHPGHTANISLAGLIGHAGITALANVRYVSANNANNLPAYSIVDAGLQLPLKHGGTLTISLLNATNRDAGTFATTRNAVPLTTEVGSFATIATPLRPHSINVAWRMPVGYGAQLIDVPNYDAGPNAYGFKLYPYPASPPTDPFAINRRSGRCGPETVPGGTKYLNIIRQYVRSIESARAQSGSYPLTFRDANVQGLRLYYRRNGNSFAVLVAVDKSLSWDDQVAILKPLSGCARIYSGFLPETQRRHLYISPYDEQQDLMPIFDFAPEVGVYHPPSLIENESLFPAYADVPNSQPPDPFALSSTSVCSSNVRSGAQALVSLLRPYITALYNHHEKPAAPEGFTITPHAGPGGTWLAIQSEDLDVKLLSQCMMIVGVDQDQLYKLGLDGTTLSLDYAPRLGFYNKL